MDLNEQVIRIPLLGVLLLVVGLAVVGFAGGLLAVWWFSPNPLPLPDANDQLITTIQEVTLSPSIAAAENVARHSRSVMLLSRTGQPEQLLGTGFVVTSDGLVATTADVTGGPVTALDENGQTSELALVGQDSVFGFTYLRASGGVFVPFEVRDSDPGAGATLLALSQNPETLTARVQTYFVEEHRLPETGEPAGWQRLLGGTELTEATVVGSPLLDDEGRVAGIVLPGRNGRAVTGTLLRLSLTRVAEGSLEQNPFAELGIDAIYRFTPDAEGVRAFTVAVEGVQPGSVAAAQGIRAGDVIVTIDNEPPLWENPIYTRLAKGQPTTLQVRRGEVVRTVTLTPRAAGSP